MATWSALNIEADEVFEEEVDDTKEIQIEEALKLYQNALKLHSQGPEFYAQAAEAYDALLNSEIFKYPESLSEFRRAALHDGDGQQLARSTNDGGAVVVAVAEPLAEYDVNDSTSSTLLQTIYLSHKNYGQFLLDSLHHVLRTTPQDSEAAAGLVGKINTCSKTALVSFAEALEKDDTDLDLWRRSARLSSALQSYRLARYCLESVLADDENRLEVRAEQLGLDETFAQERLRGTLQSLYDKLSVSQIPVQKPKKALLKLLIRQSDPFPYLPLLEGDIENAKPLQRTLEKRLDCHELTPSGFTWEAVGKEILQLVLDERQDKLRLSLNDGVKISLTEPTQPDPSIAGESTRAEPSQNIVGAGDQTAVKKEVEMTDASNPPTTGEPLATVKSQTQTSADLAEDQSSVDQRAENQLMEGLSGHAEQAPEPHVQPPDTTANEDPDPKSSIIASRKRSSTSIANEDNTEGGRTKSRRTRARESNADSLAQTDEVTFDQSKYYEDRLELYNQADGWMFETVGALFRKIGVEELGAVDELRKQFSSASDQQGSAETSETPPAATEIAIFQDLRESFQAWNEEKSRVALHGESFSSLETLRGNKSGLAIFQEHSRKSIRKLNVEKELLEGDELSAFIKVVNDGWFHLPETSLSWLKGVLMPAYGKYSFEDENSPVDESSNTETTYTSFQWSETLKDTIIQLLVQEDSFMWDRMCEDTAALGQAVLQSTSESPFTYTLKNLSECLMIETIYELHLDVYARISSPNNDSDQDTRVVQEDRLGRWSQLARTSLNYLMDYAPPGELQTRLALRHTWASTFHSNMAPDCRREYALFCLEHLKDTFHQLQTPAIPLVNNVVMFELSVAALDQEISKLKSMDFFMKIFGADSDDPVDLIETIEPILEPSAIESIPDGATENTETAAATAQIQEMISFLDRGDATLRLFLWRRLQEAYKSIEYPPKVVSCYLRSIETIIKELWGASHLEATPEDRQIALLKWLKSLEGILNETVKLVLQKQTNAYDCVDMDHLVSSMTAIVRLLKLLQCLLLYDDSVRVGQTPGPELRASQAKSLETFKDRLREMQVRCWILQYTLLKEAMAQNQELFDNPSEDCLEYLRAVHGALGVRSMCKYSSKQFLKLMKAELLSLKAGDDYEFDTCQVILDLHGIKISAFDGLADHGCPSEKLDKVTAISVIDFVMKQAKRMSITALCKSDLKTTIDKISTAIGNLKSSPPLSLNRRVVTAYLNGPMNPAHLSRAAQGVLDLSLVPVSAESSQIAQKGWFFLLGYASLTKFRSQKRLNPVPTTDLDDAVNFFRKDIENGAENWETWYRLAQTYDSKLEEDITWSADKINNNRSELLVWQRYAIHCYSMAVSTAIRTADPTLETRLLLSDLFTDFGIRMYASSREPFSMGAFDLADFSRHYSKEMNQEMYTAQPFREMKAYSVWSFGRYLLRRAIVDKPKRWINHYMLSKCLWKMFSCDDSVRGNCKRISLDELLDTLLDAIDNLPERKDSRTDPIFEPHFKLVSIVHKLVHRGTLTPAEGSKTLMATPWARKVQLPTEPPIWDPYIREILRNLRNADKSNWHHRMAARAAHVIYDDHKDPTSAMAAKHELTQQIFTKTMTIQVWKPEFERPGRHFVYTTRYAYFFVSLLDQLDDRANLDQLLRRVRKKQGDFINHTKLWEDMCTTYAKVIRRAGKINEGHEEGVFRGLTWDDFVANTARLENLSQLVPDSIFILELLRDSVELKKLNNNLMKVTMLEDLIADLYSRIYEINMPQLVEQVNEENKEKMKVDHLLMTGESTADAQTPPSAPASETPAAPRGRTKGIARRDIQKRAETIVNRKLTPRALTAKPTASTEGESAPVSGAATSAAAGTAATSTAHIGRNGTDCRSRSPPQSSAANSVHDSADDESELSEIDDDRLAKLATDRKSGSLLNRKGRLPRPPPPDPETEASDLDDGKMSKLAVDRTSLLFPTLSRGRSPGGLESEISVPPSVDEEEGEGHVEGEQDETEANRNSVEPGDSLMALGSSGAAGEGDGDEDEEGDEDLADEGEEGEEGGMDEGDTEDVKDTDIDMGEGEEIDLLEVSIHGNDRCLETAKTEEPAEAMDT
ncbi:hypothetical protein ASPZODRAFT_153767 [Penicilliopsis zonata CBS 506.65]|uniref:Histone transcription regulator 3 homolog n=1 Tax=Penicilliopsis zonata CBS 506.65 TaxID=1073090 RepID=A0A1L9SAZ9_9EURO|nr:hypothetical protein ASPZODRAFT_153767 [Penicilliopsis zonata CBS 506.65]OJJ44297.1 hypothetical protein ASPZODRAFT_153767 [Penicilliopsis zonata CBS 506.65]